MDVVGYVDTLSVAPGEPIALMVSATAAEFESEVVRLYHGDPHPEGPGYRAVTDIEPTPTRHRGVEQPLRRGSYVRVPDVPVPAGGAFTFAVWIRPVHLRAAGGADSGSATDPAEAKRWTLARPLDPVGPQAVASWGMPEGHGWHVVLSPTGVVTFAAWGGGARSSVTATGPLLKGVWTHLVAVLDPDAAELRLRLTPQAPAFRGSAPTLRPEAVSAPLDPAVPPGIDGSAELLLGGRPVTDGFGDHVGETFNGKVAAPRLHAGIVDATDLSDPTCTVAIPGALGVWDLAQGPAGRRVVDVSGNDRHGRTVNHPQRGVTGPNWDTATLSFREAPAQYGALLLHDDDLDDAAWSPARTWTVPDDLPSGAYAFRLTASTGAVDHVPFVVTPRPGRPTADVVLVLPTFSYLAYANEHSLWAVSDQVEDHYIQEQRLQGLYDKHLNDPTGAGVAYSSWLRPLMNVRPHYYWKALRGGAGGAHQFSADLHVVDWLDRIGCPVDVITDAELHHRGVEALRPYRVALTGTHAEYWSRKMLDGIEQYLAVGGRLMYLSGNGLYWVTGLDEEEGHTVEIRRDLGMSGGWFHEPGEGRLSTTGEIGGAWRERGLAPQRYVGVGTAAFLAEEAEGRGGPFTLQPGSRDPRAAFIIAGLEEAKSLGDFPNLVNGWGPVGYEADRVDLGLGSPLHTLTIASATADTSPLIPCFEEILHANPRADVAFFETAQGGAVFSTGSISWAGSLSHNGHDNDVARMTRNVLDRFRDPEPFVLPVLPERVGPAGNDRS